MNGAILVVFSGLHWKEFKICYERSVEYQDRWVQLVMVVARIIKYYDE